MQAQQIDKILVWKSIFVNTTEFTKVRKETGFRVEGTITGQGLGRLFNIIYNLDINSNWQIQSFQIDLKSESSFQIALHKNASGQWVNEKDEIQTELNTCDDIDISLTPFTNTLPIKRLNLAVGASQEINVIYIDLPTPGFKPARQRYTNLGHGIYKYESLTSGFTANLTVDNDDYVLEYPEIWHRVLPENELLSRQNEVFSCALLSNNSSPELDSVERIYDWLIGSWEVEAVDYLENGDILKTEGEWFFSWILEGRAIQDVWIAPKRSLRTMNTSKIRNRYGTTIRFFDKSIKKWRIKWMNPVSGAYDQLTGWKEKGKIIQEGMDEKGNCMRWSFEDITSKSFHWKGERSFDNGKSFVLEAEFFGKRN